MVSIFTGLGSGFERGSGATLGGAGLLGSGTLGRNGEQLSLNAATGNLLISQRDEFLVGRGPDASIARTYNSLGDTSDENHDNWRQSTDRRIYGRTGTDNSVGSTVKRVSGDGSVITYTWKDNAYVATDGSGAYDKLSYDGSAWTWTDGDSQVSETYANVYNGEWRITAARDTSSKALTFTYSGAHLDKVTTSNGEYVQYGWLSNNITQIVTGYTDLATNVCKTLTRTRYGYDDTNRLTSVTVDLSPEDNAIGDGKTYVTTYTYDGNSRVASISQTDGSRIDIDYDTSGRVIRLTQTTLGAPRVTIIAYNSGYTTISDSFDQATRLDYNADGSLAKVTAPPAYAGAAAQVSQFAYGTDGAGNVSSVTDALGAVTAFTYDGSGNVLTTTDPLGNVVTRTYGSKNELLTETRTGSDEAGGVNAHTTRFAYDASGRLRYMVTADGRVSEYRYDALGQQISSLRFTNDRFDVSALGAGASISKAALDGWIAAIVDRTAVTRSDSTYDARGELLSTTSIANAEIDVTTPVASTDSSRTSYVYDQSGQLLHRTTAGLNTEHFVYDGLGRVIASTDLSGATTSIVFDDAASRTVVTAANGYVQTSVYSVSGELISSTDSGASVVGGTAYFAFDREGQLRFSQDATGHQAYSVYDAVGRKVGDVDHYGALTEYRYDADDRVVATIRYGAAITAAQISRLQNVADNVDLASIRPASSASDLVTRTVYDAVGRVVDAISGDGSVTEYRYDGSSRLVATIVYFNRLSAAQLAALDAAPASVVLPTPDAVRDSVARNFYDKDGRLVGVLDGEGYLARTVYDAAGRSVVQTAFATATAVGLRATGTFAQLLASVGTSGADRTTRSVYDGQGLLRFSIDAQGHVVEFVYKGGADASANGVVRQTIQYAVPIGTLTRYTVATLQAALANQTGATANRNGFSVYDTANRPTYTIDAEGAVTGFSYDAYGRLTKTVQYATLSAVTTLPDLATWAPPSSTGADRITRNYYTARDELRYTVDAEGYVSRFDYDAAGRVVGTLRYDTAIAVTDGTTIAGVASLAIGPAAATATAYDNDGRVASSTDALGIVTAWRYNITGTVAAVTVAYGTADAVETRYAYDAVGRKIGETAAFGAAEQRATGWSYDGLGNMVATTDADGNTTQFAYNRAGRQIGVTDALGGVTAYQYDAFGGVVKTTDPRGNASYAYYDTLGRVIATRDAEDYVTETSYTNFGEIDLVTRRANRAANAVTNVPTYTADPARDATTRFGYDRLGRVLSTIDALNFSESYTLDAFGQRVTVTGKLGAVTANAYDRRGLLTSETLPISSVRSDGSSQATSVVNTFGYDARGNRTVMVEAAGLTEQRITNYVYDKLDRLIETRLPVVANVTGTGTVSPIDYVVYDARGNVIEQRDAAGARTLFYYDKLDRQIASIGATGSYATTSYAIVVGTGGTQTSRSYATPVALPTNPGGAPPAPPPSEYRETIATYDKLGRLDTSAMSNVRTGSWNGSVYTTAIGTVTARWQYDAHGNVVKTVDATGAATFSYYDKLGRKTAQVDQLGYLTTWTLDGEGNALSETRYATATNGAAIGTPPAASTAVTDRTTTFTYDRVGQRLTETRLGLDYYTINSGGTLALASGGSATVAYTYNALGQVLTKTEATGEAIGYSYDTAGRLSLESRTTYLDQNGAAVTPSVRYFYDALGNLTRSQQGGANAASTDRVTSYGYGAGGRLTATTDAAGQVRSYYYDMVGRKTGEAYDRVKSDGSTVLREGLSYQYDAVGNLTRQAFATVSGGNFSDAGDVTTLAYNAYGDVVSRGLNGMQQESSAYDSAGRLWRSTSGDGVWRYYVYDANGKQTLALEDAGIGNLALVDQSLAQVLAIATGNGANTVGAAYVAGINATITQLDARGQAVTALQTKRQVSATGTPVDLVSQRGYNAFGEAVSDTDALGYTTTTRYNATGKAILVQRAPVSIGNADGMVTTGTPTDTLFYDVSGRLIGQQDANGKVTSRVLLGGTGYGQATAVVLREYHPDGGVKQGGYDVYGDLRTETDEVARVTSNSYDALGRLTQVARAGGLIDYYAYDALGQRTRHTDSVRGGGDAETTDYDVQGRVVATRAFGGDITTQSYSWNTTIGTTGLAHFGGYQQITTFANGKTITETSDAFGHVAAHIDMGGRTFYYRYDSGGRLLAREGGYATQRYTYLNTGLAASVSTGTGLNPNYTETATAAYSYDKLGRKLTEYATTGGQVTQDATASYDALGRMTTWSDAGGSVLANGVSLATPPASVTWSYDAVGNIRHQTQAFSYLDGNGAVSGQGSASWWYAYDAMNRVTVDRGTLSNGAIVRGQRGVDLTYTAAGERRTATSDRVLSGGVQVFVYDNPGGLHVETPDPENYGHYETQQRYYNGETRETYSYNADGTLASTVIGETSYTDDGNGNVVVNVGSFDRAGGGGVYSYDALGRQTSQVDINDAGAIVYDHRLGYDAKGRVISDWTSQIQGNDTVVTSATTYYGDGTAAYALGAALRSETTGYRLINHHSYEGIPTSQTVTAYDWYDGAVQSRVDYTTPTAAHYTTYVNSGVGVLQSADIRDGRQRFVSVTSDALGQAIRRDEKDQIGWNATTLNGGDPHEMWYRFNGKQIGYTGNNSTYDSSYAGSLADRARTVWSGGNGGAGGAFRFGFTVGQSYADFNDQLTPINSYSQGSQKLDTGHLRYVSGYLQTHLGDPYENRTRAYAVRGRRPNR